MTAHKASRPSFAIRACVLAAAVALGCASAATAHAESLMDAYRQALQQDPVLKQAEAGARIGQAGAAITRAPLLPQINGQVSFSDSHGSQTGPQLVENPDGSTGVQVFKSDTGGRSRTDSIGLNQVLFDMGEFEQWRASTASAKASEAQYVAAQQNLILRVAQAYFTILSDEDQLKFAKANAKALKKQFDQAKAKFDVQLVAITDVVDAKAQYETARANVVNAENIVFTDRQALAEITGQPTTGALEILGNKLPLVPPQPDNMDEWVKTALASNPSLEAQRDQLDAAQHDVSAAHAGHLPTLGASISYQRNPTWGGTSNIRNTTNLPANLRGDTRTTGTAVGLVLTVPLFQGGGIIARAKQAIAQRDQTRDLLEQDRRTTVSNTRNAFNAITAGISALEAQKAAVESAKTALDATQAGYSVGTSTIVDVLLAQETFFQAQSAYSAARHALVINRLNLEFSAGTLNVKDLEAVNALLQ